VTFVNSTFSLAPPRAKISHGAKRIRLTKPYLAAASSVCRTRSPAPRRSAGRPPIACAAPSRGLGIRTTRELLRQARERSTSPFHDFRLSRGVTWLEPTLTVELTYSELMEGRLRPVYRGVRRGMDVTE